MDVRRRSLIGSIGEGAIDINNYLTIEALESGLIVSLSTNACEYCIDGKGPWVSLTAATNAPSINSGQTISFRGKISPSMSVGVGTFSVNKRFNLLGNAMSMIFGDSGKSTTSLSGKSYAFYNLFNGCTKLVTVAKNFLPATTLSSTCYSGMFEGCTSLTSAPLLPAATLQNFCYQNMFKSCTSLKSCPSLSATTLSSYCYNGMFEGCSNLTSTPTLPASTLASNCYYGMFRNCTSLTTAPSLPATTLASYCYANMFAGCIALTTPPSLQASTLQTYCYQYMFDGCTALKNPPALPSTKLADRCYYYMFRNCKGLTTAPELPAKTLMANCYYGLFNGCSNLNYIKMLATDISATGCLSSWVYGVASSGTFVKSSSMTDLPSGISGIPNGWTVQNA